MNVGHRPGRKVIGPVAVAALAGSALVVAAFAWERSALWSARNGLQYSTTPPDPWRAYAVKGVDRPPVVRGPDAVLAPDAVVIGVVIDGKARAYSLETMADRHHHVVNDLVANVPVTVAYCNITDCIQVYTNPETTAPLDVSLAGAMVIKVEGVLYDHQTGRALEPGDGPATIRFPRLEPVRTTWRQWRAEHPDTDVYTGDPPFGPGIPPAQAKAPGPVNMTDPGGFE